MSPFHFDMLILGAVIAGVAIGGIYLFMLAVPRNEDEHTYDALGEPGHFKTHLLRAIVQLRHKFSR